MKRREFLQRVTGVLLACGLLPRSLRASEQPQRIDQVEGIWRFIAVNDLHFLEAACRPWFETVVAAMKRETPDAAFCLISGDLADGGTESQLAEVRQIFAALEIPVYVTPGNHDYLTDDDRKSYEKIYPG